ncbi:hypothetical protein GQX74_008584 [Glossina fuscipes]|nr:hypothetical protein GQX74_008584 [Glossina fuscipes]
MDNLRDGVNSCRKMERRNCVSRIYEVLANSEKTFEELFQKLNEEESVDMDDVRRGVNQGVEMGILGITEKIGIKVNVMASSPERTMMPTPAMLIAGVEEGVPRCEAEAVEEEERRLVHPPGVGPAPAHAPAHAPGAAPGPAPGPAPASALAPAHAPDLVRHLDAEHSCRCVNPIATQSHFI